MNEEEKSIAMELPSTFNIFVTIFVSFPFLILLFNLLNKHRNVKKLPPGPWKLPLLGSIHHLVGKLPHHILKDLSRKYGPLVHLQLGEIPVLVVTSPKFAKEIMVTHDPIFASRPKLLSFKVLFYDSKDIAFRPYDDYWRQMRKICVQELLGSKKVSSLAPVRLAEGEMLVASVKKSAGKVVNMTDKIYLYTSSVVCKAAFGKISIDEGAFVQLIKEAADVSGGFNIADMFPSFKWLHSLSGMMPRLLKTHGQIDAIVEDIINVHIQNSASTNRGNGEFGEEDIIDILLRIKESNSLSFPIDNDNIKAIILDIFAAGNETSSTSTIWTMAELMRNPQVMEKAQKEIRKAFEGKESIDEADIKKLDYLNLVIKEALRLHPPAPLIPARESIEDCVVDGYKIPVKTKIVVNAWALGRDPEYWNDPDSFIPERFQNSPIDYMGDNFQFIPFGAGRRICPGISFGIRNMQIPLALLLYHFDWNLPNAMKPEDVDMTESFGAAARRTAELCLIPTLPSKNVSL